MVRCDLVTVAVDEAGVQCSDQRLSDRCVAVQPRRVGERGVTEQRTLQAGQLGHGELGLRRCGAADFIADDRRIRVAEQYVEDA